MRLSRRQIVIGGPVLLASSIVRAQRPAPDNDLSDYLYLFRDKLAAYRLGRLCATNLLQDQLQAIRDQVITRLSSHRGLPTPLRPSGRSIVSREIKRDFLTGNVFSIRGLAVSATEVALLHSFYASLS